MFFLQYVPRRDLWHQAASQEFGLLEPSPLSLCHKEQPEAGGEVGQKLA